jgi:mannitol 2-dehydrogenase
LNAGLGIDGLALEVALWCRYCAGRRDDGSPLTVEDENAERLGETARRAEHDPMAFLSMTDIFGPLGGNAAFAAAFSQALKTLYRDGIAKTLDSYAKGGVSDPV